MVPRKVRVRVVAFRPKHLQDIFICIGLLRVRVECGCWASRHHCGYGRLFAPALDGHSALCNDALPLLRESDLPAWLRFVVCTLPGEPIVTTLHLFTLLRNGLLAGMSAADLRHLGCNFRIR